MLAGRRWSAKNPLHDATRVPCSTSRPVACPRSLETARTRMAIARLVAEEKIEKHRPTNYRVLISSSPSAVDVLVRRGVAEKVESIRRRLENVTLRLVVVSRIAKEGRVTRK